MTKGTDDRRQAARTPRDERAVLRDHLPPGGGAHGRTATPERPPDIEEPAGASRGRETRGEVETATMRYLEESEQGPK